MIEKWPKERRWVKFSIQGMNIASWDRTESTLANLNREKYFYYNYKECLVDLCTFDIWLLPFRYNVHQIVQL